MPPSTATAHAHACAYMRPQARIAQWMHDARRCDAMRCAAMVCVCVCVCVYATCCGGVCLRFAHAHARSMMYAHTRPVNQQVWYTHRYMCRAATHTRQRGTRTPARHRHASSHTLRNTNDSVMCPSHGCVARLDRIGSMHWWAQTMRRVGREQNRTTQPHKQMLASNRACQ